MLRGSAARLAPSKKCVAPSALVLVVVASPLSGYPFGSDHRNSVIRGFGPWTLIPTNWHPTDPTVHPNELAGEEPGMELSLAIVLLCLSWAN